MKRVELRGVAAIGTALALVAVGGVQAGSATSISITVSTKNPPVRGLVWTKYGSPAQVTGKIGSGQAGVAVVLQANTFPFKNGFSASGHAKTAAGGTFTFSPKPTLATHYRVALGTDPASTSRAATVYVTAREIHSFGCANGYVCNLRVKDDFIYPPAVAAQEGSKTVYFYVGVRYGSQTKAPARVKLVQTSPQRRVSAHRFRVNFAYSFPTPQAYFYSWVTCTKNTEALDGLFLPGQHHCGDRSIPFPAFTHYVRLTLGSTPVTSGAAAVCAPRELLLHRRRAADVHNMPIA